MHNTVAQCTCNLSLWRIYANCYLYDKFIKSSKYLLIFPNCLPIVLKWFILTGPNGPKIILWYGRGPGLRIVQTGRAWPIKIVKVPSLIKRIPNTLFPKYADWLGLFHLVPLEIKLIKIDLIILYRIASGVLEVPGVNVNLLRSHHLPGRLQITSLRTTLCGSFYVHRTSMIWNKYKQLSSIAQFKSFSDTPSWSCM